MFSEAVKLTFLISLSTVLTVVTILLILNLCDSKRRNEREENPFSIVLTSLSIIITVVSIVVSIFSMLHKNVENPIDPPETPIVENSFPSTNTPIVPPPDPTPTNSETVQPPKTPSPNRTPLPRYDNISAVTIVDMSDQGFDTGLGTEHFSIQPSISDNFGNTYDLAGVFSWQRDYAVSGYVVFYVTGHSKLTGQLVAIDGERPSDNATVVMYLDDVEVARFTGIEKTTMPTDFEIDLTNGNLLRIETNSQEIMYVNFKFYVDPN